jgi:recombination protein RecR
MIGPEIEALIQLLSRLPGLGPRSARRAALHLLDKRDILLVPLAQALDTAAKRVLACPNCGNLDTVDPCSICADASREPTLLCVVADVASLWALERSQGFKGRYHVLGGLLSALDGIGPTDLGLDHLINRVQTTGIKEVILATPATVDGQTTAHYIADRLNSLGIAVTGLAHGVPVGGELDYLDDGTINAALRARHGL